MRIKTIFLIANGSSILFMTTFLIIGYISMFLSVEMIGWLSLLTLVSALVSFILYYLLTSPVERSIQRLTEEAGHMSTQDFGTSIPEEGPLEIRLLTRRFNDMSNRLSRSFEAIQKSETSRKELVANISHDLRTPMASIRAFIQAIQDGIVDDPKSKAQYMQTISLEVERLDQMIQQLFELSVYDSGQLEIHKTAIAADQWLLEVLEHERFSLENEQIEVNIDLPERASDLYIDKEKMKRVMINLLDNAIRHSKKHSIITIGLTLKQEDTILYIKDEGEGISPEHLPHIFERTYRVEASRNRKYAGTGLGLAIAKHIVEAHDGTITVSSELGKGSCFRIELPKGETPHG
ncbi:sensor histidine kinase [Halobacillus salinus]|uniref:sensor histidine kinase n=1 Tax=Halobacillus salinus TaxID=192814 RepID=UPI0009A6298E|nr:ATP-binding protein [Halobacillus salinus]